MVTKDQLQTQLQRLRNTGFADKLSAQATAKRFPVPFFFAIASRETNCVNELGDFQDGEAHGVGIIQIDIQHPIARQARDNGSWRTNPDPLIDFGAQLLAQNIEQAKQAFPDLPAPDQLKVAASGYNCGIGNAISGASEGDSDRHTTGHYYGADVISRMEMFEELLNPPDSS
jgi:hypothetical protein